MERKFLDLGATGVKMDSDNGLKFSGYASVFNGIDSYGDRIAPGAYKNTLSERDRPVQLRWNHFGPVIGKWTRLEEDEKGLWAEGELTPGHSVAEDAAAVLKHGAISGLSIGYRVKSSEDHKDYKLLKEIDLFEISVVESPADNSAHIQELKGLICEADSYKEIEAILRDAGGFSRADATMLVNRVKALSHGERVEKQDASTAAINRLLQIQSKLGV